MVNQKKRIYSQLPKIREAVKELRAQGKITGRSLTPKSPVFFEVLEMVTTKDYAKRLKDFNDRGRKRAHGTSHINSLFSNEEASDENSLDLTIAPEPQACESLQERLGRAIGSVENVHSSESCSKSDKVKKDLDFYERTGERRSSLLKLSDALGSIQSTSTQSERNFSLAAGIATKLRSRMSSKKLNACCFLKCFFKRRDNQYAKLCLKLIKRSVCDSTINK